MCFPPQLWKWIWILRLTPGLQADLEDLTISDEASDASDEDSGDEDMDDPIAVERRRRIKKQDQLRRTAGEPVKPVVTEILKLADPFGIMLRHVLAD
jgi:hypothetical protein